MSKTYNNPNKNLENKSNMNPNANPNANPEVLQRQFKELVDTYWQSKPFISDNITNHELEVRFGTRSRNMQPLTKYDYDHVIERLKSIGFVSNNQEGEYLLRIQNEYHN